jgi:hypothetical protein
LAELALATEQAALLTDSVLPEPVLAEDNLPQKYAAANSAGQMKSALWCW